jgi:type VI secretion system protein ImpK
MQSAAGPLQSGSGHGLSALLAAATPLILLAGRLRGSRQAADVPGLRRQALEEIRRFEDRATRAGVPADLIVAARYALCATLDEAVLATPWGGQSEWSQQTLRVTLHGETWGGEKYFDMLLRTWDQPARFIDLMELQYLCLAMGFGGKYQVQKDGSAQLADIQNQLYRRIRQHRGAAAPALSLRWQGEQNRRTPQLRWVPWWGAAAASLLLVFAVYAVFQLRLGSLAAPVEQRLAAIGLREFSAPVPVAPAPGPTLKELLSGAEAAGLVGIEEDNGVSRVTLLAQDLFESASATVNPAHYESLRDIARALNTVGGRVLVTGHTDNQPLRSIRFRDNFALSRARAEAVIDILKLAIDNPARLESRGLGDTEPAYEPPSLPENRARNRRVGIWHVGRSS